MICVWVGLGPSGCVVLGPVYDTCLCFCPLAEFAAGKRCWRLEPSTLRTPLTLWECLCCVSNHARPIFQAIHNNFVLLTFDARKILQPFRNRPFLCRLCLAWRDTPWVVLSCLDWLLGFHEKRSVKFLPCCCSSVNPSQINHRVVESLQCHHLECKRFWNLFPRFQSNDVVLHQLETNLQRGCQGRPVLNSSVILCTHWDWLSRRLFAMKPVWDPSLSVLPFAVSMSHCRCECFQAPSSENCLWRSLTIHCDTLSHF